MRSVSQTDSQAHHHSFEYIKLGIKFRYHIFQLCYVLKNILFEQQKTTRKHRAWLKKKHKQCQKLIYSRSTIIDHHGQDGSLA